MEHQIEEGWFRIDGARGLMWMASVLVNALGVDFHLRWKVVDRI